jgi:hypothetical protein
MRSPPRRKPGGGDISRKKKLLEKRKKGNVGGSKKQRGALFSRLHGCEGPLGDQRSIWQCEHSAGSVYRRVADGGGVTTTPLSQNFSRNALRTSFPSDSPDKLVKPESIISISFSEMHRVF